MDYRLNFKGQTIKLPAYSLALAEKLEKQETINSGGKSLLEKCTSMYDLCSELIGNDLVKNIIGTLDTLDPNELNMLYLTIINSYNAPLSEFSQSQANDKLSRVSDTMSQLSTLLNNVEVLKGLQK